MKYVTMWSHIPREYRFSDDDDPTGNEINSTVGNGRNDSKVNQMNDPTLPVYHSGKNEATEIRLEEFPAECTVGRMTKKLTRWVMGHSLVRSLICSHRSHICLLRTASFTRSFVRSWERGVCLWKEFINFIQFQPIVKCDGDRLQSGAEATPEEAPLKRKRGRLRKTNQGMEEPIKIAKVTPTI